ncbi:MAG TPA: isovaleryl-CoA dehydrogenase [Solirubrobacterales bacterium]|nr:isovaleryl-CoA dehydrogenase [Solirubrobacterales bacterium]HMU27122.1 isovaleryl-CoA dehydrogenase [Solirubrobacterales bacterium]HMX71847.1 isovaleryl-CoA dehydrogenase [Solirubrobacterales bacterium]HMY26166.1 isovaleryl-CoA dehydrogenase [Solirubrobacterales bacterium]HNA23811.1 isovaleryl-CoA dehydrogenase [Solirubrobacterales bacterium]
MLETAEAPQHETHTVFNQSTPLENVNLYEIDLPLQEAVNREGAGWAEDRIKALGEICGQPEVLLAGRDANEFPPRLKAFDRFGNRIDEVEFHPAWHELMALGIEHDLHALPWREPGIGANVARAALFTQLTQVEAGVGCPISMTFSVIPSLRNQPEVAEEWEPRFTSLEYDGKLKPADQKPGCLAGMAMTEKQGGSDVRANTTRAVPLNGGGPGGEYEITGHKWFCSAPMCDAFLVLAQTDAGVSCFLLPRFTPNGERNRFHIQRLKEKLGNKSNASSEIEFRGAWARMIGEDGRGIRTIIEMVSHTRLDCAIGSSAGMRTGVAQATHHAMNRSAFGKKLIDQPLMENVLADLCVESEAATATVMRLARAYDEAAAGDEGAALLQRLATPVLKYWICKRAPWHAVESLECFGGNGYAEESGMPRLFRESPLMSIWEGSGNVQCLDALRAMVKSPASYEAFFSEVGEAAGADSRLDSFVEKLQQEITGEPETLEIRARRVVEGMGLAFQGSMLVRHGDPAVADAFCASRLAGDWGEAFGTLPAGTDFKTIIQRSAPPV